MQPSPIADTASPPLPNVRRSTAPLPASRNRRVPMPRRLIHCIIRQTYGDEWMGGSTLRTVAGETLFITGGSRGIGLAIALRAAADGANVVVAAKTAEPNPKLPGPIFTAAREIEQAGGG